MQVTGQETALAASDESSQTAKVKEVTAGEGEGADGQMKEVENNVPDQSNEPSPTTGSKPATPSKEAPNSNGNGESSPPGENIDEGGEANGDSIVTVIEKSPEPPVSSSVGGENGTAAISEEGNGELPGDYAAEEGPGDSDIPSLSSISRDQGGPHQANIVLVDSGPASSLFGITEHKISSASTNGGSILESLSEEDLASMAATSAVEDDGAGGIISSGVSGQGGSGTSSLLQSHKESAAAAMAAAMANAMALITPTSPRSVTTASISASDDMVEHENETLRDRVSDLEKRVHDQNDEITCLRATLADALRRINTLEAGKEHVQVNHNAGAEPQRQTSVGGREVRLRPRGSDSQLDIPGGWGGGGGGAGTPTGHRMMYGRRPGSSGTMTTSVTSNASSSGGGGGHPDSRAGSAHEMVNRRASYASNRDKYIHKALSRRSGGMYQSTGSLHSDGQSSNSMSPAPSPSPTHHNGGGGGPAARGAGAAQRTPSGPPPAPSAPGTPGTGAQAPGAPRALSNSMSNLAGSLRDQSPVPNGTVARRLNQGGSMQSLRSPFGSQQNLDRSYRHGTKDASYNLEDGSVRMYIRGRPVQLFAPSPLVDTYSLSKVSPAPPNKLKLEWVYGYRGRDARSNLYLLPTGEIIYFVAAVVVLFNAEEHSQRHYLGHTEEIKCLAVHPNKLLIATGQASGHDRREGRPHIRIWNSVSLQTLHVIGVGDFERSVCCISFSKADGGNLLVAVDEGSEHTMSVWDWARSERGSKITETKCATETVVAAEFHPLEAGVIVSCGKGHVNFWQLDSTSLTLSRKTGLFDQRDKPKYVTCLAFSFTGDVLTGDSNGNVFIWGRGFNAVTKALRKVHDGPIFAICVLKDGSIVTGGGKDRRLVLFDASYRKVGSEAELPQHLGSTRTISQGKGSQLVLGTTRNSILQGTFDLNFQEIVTGHVDEVWALASHPTQNQFISAGFDQHIHLWDTLTHRAVWSSHIGDQAQSAAFSPDGEAIVIGMSSGRWMVLDASTREIYGLQQDGTEPIQIVKFSPNGNFLALGSRDNIIYIYQVMEKYKKLSRMGRCMGDSRRRRTASSGSMNNSVGHSSSLTHLDWSKDSTYIQSTSGDYELLFWNASICRQVPNGATLRDVEWASQSCLLSFNTIGVWPETVDGTDLNCCSRSNNQKFAVTGDDFGKIKLYSYPVTQPKSLYHATGGHSSQVTRVEFLVDDNRLLSAGGRDTALMQWEVAN